MFIAKGKKLSYKIFLKTINSLLYVLALSFSNIVIAVPSSVDSPISGGPLIFSPILQQSSKWHFNQYVGNFHIFGGGVGSADDRNSWDINYGLSGHDNCELGTETTCKPVYAVEAGTVYKNNGWGGASVGQLLINHTTGNDQWSTGYLHMINITTKSYVEKGEMIGLLSDVGVPGAYHLHFAVYDTWGKQGLTSVDVPINETQYPLEPEVTSFGVITNSPSNYSDFTTNFGLKNDSNSNILIEDLAFSFYSTSTSDYSGIPLGKCYRHSTAGGSQFTILGSGGTQLLANRTCNLPNDAPSPGTYTLVYKVKYNGSFTTVKTKTVTIEETSSSDLIVQSFSVSDTTLTTSSAPINLSAVVKNNGVVSSSSTILRFYLSTNNILSSEDLQEASFTISSLAPGQTSTKNINLIKSLSPGTYYYGACVDSLNNESSQTNNCSTAVAITVSAPTSPDLIVQPPSVNDSTLTVGESFILSATVKNQGNGSSNATPLRYYLSSNSTIYPPSDTSVGSDPVNTLNPGSTSPESISLNSPTAAGTYYYGACVDSVTNESLTNNNCSIAVAITVSESTSPDLIVQPPSVNDSTLTVGESFILSATVKNQGNGSSNATPLRYYLSSNSTISPSSDTTVGSDPVNTLNPGSTSPESISLNAPTTAGTYYYGACVDSVTNESLTNNNCSSAVLVTVTGASLGDLFEPDNSFNASKNIGLNSIQSHSISPVTDVDWVTFTLSEQSSLIIETFGDVGNDTVLGLYNSSGNLVLENDDHSGLYSRISYDCAAPLQAGIYYVKINEFANDAEISEYSLSLSNVQSCSSEANTRVILRSEIAKPLIQAIYGPEFIPFEASGTLFADVNQNDFNADWIETLAAFGLTEGCYVNNYCPNHVVTKAQLSEILLKAKFGVNYTPTLSSGLFTDINENTFNVEWIEELFIQGIAEGCAVNKFCPEEAVTIEGFLGMLNRALP